MFQPKLINIRSQGGTRISEQESSTGSNLSEIEQTDQEYVFGTWSYQKKIAPTKVVDINVVRFTTADGNGSINFFSQLMSSSLGRSAEKVADTVDKQLREAVYVVPIYTTENRTKLGKKLTEVTPAVFRRHPSRQAALRLLKRRSKYHASTRLSRKLSRGAGCTTVRLTAQPVSLAIPAA